MNLRQLLLFAVTVALPLVATAQWTAGAAIFQGPSTDTHPALLRRLGLWGSQNDVERMAFTQSSGNGSRICLAQTANSGMIWQHSLVRITDDSVWSDFPAYASTSYNGNPDSTFMVLWEQGTDHKTIWYRYNPDTAWLPPSLLSGGGTDERCPSLGPTDSGYFAVWESDGRIAFAEFFHGAWSTPEFVTAIGDTGNRNPQVMSTQGWPGIVPMVVWENPKSGKDTCAVVYSVRTSTGWNPVDTIGWTADNRRPRFSQPGNIWGIMEVTYESKRNGSWDIFAARATTYMGGMNWITRAEPVTSGSESGTDNREATLFYWPIITSVSSQLRSYPDIAGVWATGSETSDSIAFSSWSPGIEYQTLGQGTINRSPSLSTDIWSNGYIRLFAVWESNVTGRWKLYESHIDLDVGDVKIVNGLPQTAELEQNYPNPFNSSTNFSYRITAREFVGIEVFDLLGREVVTLVNEVKQPGTYTVRWDASRVASGMYFCRMSSGSFLAGRKVLLLK